MNERESRWDLWDVQQLLSIFFPYDFNISCPTVIFCHRVLTRELIGFSKSFDTLSFPHFPCLLSPLSFSSSNESLLIHLIWLPSILNICCILFVMSKFHLRWTLYSSISFIRYDFLWWPSRLKCLWILLLYDLFWPSSCSITKACAF